MRREVPRRKPLYLPAITIIALAFTLIVIVAVSSYRNIRREQGRADEHLLREGKVLLDVFEERSLSEILLALLSGRGWEASLQRLAEDMARNPMLKYILIADRNGKIVVHSQSDKIGRFVDPGISSSDGVVVNDDFGGGKVYVLALPFTPISKGLDTKLSSVHKILIEESSIESALSNHWAVVGMNMQEFEESRTEDLRHTIMMGVMMLVIGSASLYFIVVVQNYYLVNRTLNTMRTYTQNVVESMVNGLLSVDESGIITTINQMAAQIIGIEESTAEGQHISDVLKSDDFSIQELLKNDEPIVERESICHCSGLNIPLNISSSQLKDEAGKVMGAVIIIRDMREIRELQEKVRRAERLASLGRLAAGIAHEIRNPLSSIRGFAHYFQGKFEPETKDVKYAKAMVGEIDRLNRIIEALLDFARPAEPELQPCSIENVLNHVLQLVQTDVNAKEARVVTDIEDDIPDVMLDRDQMIQALLNILLNAVNAVDKGGEISISICMEMDTLQIGISDTGSGIPLADLPRVFDPFFTTRKDGTGLGLAIVHRIIENHNGEIGVDSKAGEGATFTIRLPFRKEGKKNV
jgi:two-component system sensor histidine kinase HydH